MPNRIIRDWTDSTTIDKISCQAERFFVRLIMKADDYGCYHANLRLLHISLFPWKRDITEDNVNEWLSECQKAGLLTTYTAENKECLVIHNFNQTLRAKNRKFPAPPTVEQDTPSPKRKKTSSKKTPPPKGKLFGTEYDELLSWMQENSPAVLRMPQPLKEDQLERLRQTYTIEQIHELLVAMNNSTKLSKYSSAYSTFTTWAKNQKWTTHINNTHDTAQHQEGHPTALQDKIERAFARGQGTSTSH